MLLVLLYSFAVENKKEMQCNEQKHISCPTVTIYSAVK